jgi:Phage tail assembly chaperone proteins, E, or 41 or 14
MSGNSAPSTGERKVVTLSIPVTHQGTKYTTLSLRRPKLKDSRLLVDADKDPIGAQANYFGQLAEVPPGLIEELDTADFKQLQGWVKSFTKDIEKK